MTWTHCSQDTWGYSFGKENLDWQAAVLGCFWDQRRAHDHFLPSAYFQIKTTKCSFLSKSWADSVPLSIPKFQRGPQV